MQVYTIDHHRRDETTGQARLRLDADIDMVTGDVMLATADRRAMVQGERDADWFQAYSPAAEDGYEQVVLTP
jgi:hypothetical protein